MLGLWKPTDLSSHWFGSDFIISKCLPFDTLWHWKSAQWQDENMTWFHSNNFEWVLFCRLIAYNVHMVMQVMVVCITHIVGLLCAQYWRDSALTLSIVHLLRPIGLHNPNFVKILNLNPVIFGHYPLIHHLNMDLWRRGIYMKSQTE
jgi:hypothetical protein